VKNSCSCNFFIESLRIASLNIGQVAANSKPVSQIRHKIRLAGHAYSPEAALAIYQANDHFLTGCAHVQSSYNCDAYGEKGQPFQLFLFPSVTPFNS
jgi:hypothetical protein